MLRKTSRGHKPSIRVVLCTLFVSMLLSCGAQQTQKREVGSFYRIKTSGSVNVFYTQSDTVSISVKANSDALEKVETTVQNSVLTISNKGMSEGPVDVMVSNSSLLSLESTGATNFKSTNTIKTDSFAVNLAGSSHAKINFQGRNLKCVQSGASSAVLTGSTDILDANVSGASTLKAFNLTSNKVNVVATGAASARIFANEAVTANAAGASDVRIKGNPSDVITESGGAANISRVSDEAGRKNRKDTVAYNWKGKKVIVVDKDDNEKKPSKKRQVSGNAKHWRGISLGTNGYVNPAGTLAMNNQFSYMELNYARSLNLQINPFERDFRLVKNYVRLVTGLGLDIHWYHFANNTLLNGDSAFTAGDIDSSNIYSYQKNNLRTIYVQVPLLLEFNFNRNPRKGFHMAVGVIGQYLIGSRIKQELERNRFEITQIRKDTYNLNPFGAKAHVNLGYRNLTVYGEYNLTSLFQKNRGPELYPFAAGIRIIPFS